MKFGSSCKWVSEHSLASSRTFYIKKLKQMPYNNDFNRVDRQLHLSLLQL